MINTVTGSWEVNQNESLRVLFEHRMSCTVCHVVYYEISLNNMSDVVGICSSWNGYWPGKRVDKVVYLIINSHDICLWNDSQLINNPTEGRNIWVLLKLLVGNFHDNSVTSVIFGCSIARQQSRQSDDVRVRCVVFCVCEIIICVADWRAGRYNYITI